jgi:hypothetical protein
MTTPPPKGFIYAGNGPLAHPSPNPTFDIVILDKNGGKWLDDPCSGCSVGYYAVREDSPVAIANGFSSAAPDPALAAFNALAAQINAKLDSINARLDRMDSRASAMETTTDPTLRELPWNPEWPEPPPLPEGKTRWVNRGSGFQEYVPTGERVVYFLMACGEWQRTYLFSHSSLYHIEAV